MKCSRTGCPRTATRKPIINFTAEPNATRCALELNLPICLHHAQSQPELFVSDAAWSVICSAMRQNGLQEPDRSTVQIQFTVIQ